MSPEKTYHLRDVFGINRDVPLNYVVRENIDNVLLDQLTRDHHLVIHGSSKQGKTCLRKHNLKDEDYIVVTCLNKWNLSELYAAILKQAGYEILQSSKITVGGRHKIEARFVGEGSVPLVAKTRAEGTYSYDKGSGEITRKPLELDFEEATNHGMIVFQCSFRKLRTSSIGLVGIGSKVGTCRLRDLW